MYIHIILTSKIFSFQVASNQFFNVNQQIPKINPVSTQLLQTLNRDPRLRKVETAVKTSPTLNAAVKHPVFKVKEDKKLDKPKRDTKHRDSKRKERSPSCSPSKKELLRKLHKKPDRKERSPRDEKYHKRREDKKIKEPELKKKNIISNLKVQQNDIVTVNHEIPIKDDEKLLKAVPKTNNVNKDLHVIQPIETNVPKEKIMISEIVKEVELNIPSNITSELMKTDSPLEDSDSLKRLRKYMQTMKKSPEPSTTLSVDLKNDSDNIRAIKPNQSKINMPDQLYFIIKFIVGDLLLFLNKLHNFLRRNKRRNFTSPKNSYLDFFFRLYAYEWLYY